MDYILMNRNMPIMEVSKEEGDTEFLQIGEKLNTEYAPWMVYKHLDKDNDALLEVLTKWYRNRAIPNNRDNKNKILERFGVRRTEELLNMDYGLSLSDQYWLKPVDESIEWEDINYFHNAYDSNVFFDAAYGDGSYPSLQTTIQDLDKYRTPNNSLNGQLRKAWVYIGGKHFMFKGTNTIHGFEQINEVLAAKICEVLEVPFVHYDLKIIEGRKNYALLSVCPCIVDDKTEMVSAYEIMYGEKGLFGDERDVNRYIEILESHHVPHAREYVEKMFMLDYIMLNEDRHMGNFAILRDVESLNWRRVCPVYDSGRSMCTNITEAYWDFKENDVKCFGRGMICSERLTTCFTTPIKKAQIQRLRMIADEYADLLQKYQDYVKLFDRQITKLSAGLMERICLFEAVMKEKNLII